MGRAEALSSPLEEAARALAGAERVVVFTGAGVSAESGVPTFRGQDGLWRHHRAEDLATPQAFRRDPCLVWEWYAWRRQCVAACEPNEGHRAIARFAARRGASVLVVTQNVDALHEAAAAEVEQAPTTEPLHLHGRLFGTCCSECSARPLDQAAPVDATSVETLPRCTACGGLLRPDVVWFGEALSSTVLTEAFRRAAAADVCVAAGTSGVVQPAASVPLATRSTGGRVIEVNPRRTALTEACDWVLTGPGATVLPALLDPS